MADICNHCNQEIKMEQVGDVLWLATDVEVSKGNYENHCFHDKCWLEVEKDYRAKKSSKGKWIRNWVQKHIVKTSDAAGQHIKTPTYGYNWKTNQWTEADLTKNIDYNQEWGTPTNTDNNRERERERAITNSDCWVRSYN